MKKTEKRKRGRAESHGIFKMQGPHVDRHLDVGLGRESEASAMTARATGQVESTGICHQAKNEWIIGSSTKDTHRMHSDGSRRVHSQEAPGR